MSTEVLTPVKGVSATSLILSIEAGKEGRFLYSERGTIAPLISGRIKDKYPELEYETEKDGDHLIVRRLK